LRKWDGVDAMRKLAAIEPKTQVIGAQLAQE